MTDYTPIDYDECKHVTDQAALLIIDGDEVWLPLSVVEDAPEVGDSGLIDVAEWFALKEGLI